MYSRVDDGWEDLDTGGLDGDDERRSGSTSSSAFGRSLGKKSGVGIDDHTNDENTDNVEEQDSVESLSDSRRNSLSRVLGFTDRNSNEFSTHVCEQSEDESIDESEESTETDIVENLVWLEGTSVCPVSETDSLLAGNTSEIDDETKKNETGEGDDLDER
jgi:hypothetical protein